MDMTATKQNSATINSQKSPISCLVNRFDHLEMATLDIAKLQKVFEGFGFVNTQFRTSDKGVEKLMLQGQTRVLLNQGNAGTFAHEYASKHGDGVCSIAFHSESAEKTLKTAIERGAKLAMNLHEEKGSSGSHVRRAAIQSFGDVRATFVERSEPAFDVHQIFAPGFQNTDATLESTKGLGMLSIDHLTNNVEMGEMERWADFYKNIYGWIEARYFDIRAEHTGLFSKVLQSPDGAVKIPVNEATEEKSQVQEFIREHKGPGVQHIALTTNDIRSTVRLLRDRGVKFLDIPSTYYEDVPKRLPWIKEDLNSLQELNILIDGDEKGYLLQIFTENQIGPLFFEIIQRQGHNGFGEGNFRALFEAIERDQKKRGVL